MLLNEMQQFLVLHACAVQDLCSLPNEYHDGQLSYRTVPGQASHEQFHSTICPDKDFLPKIVIISLPIYLNMCFGCSKEVSHLETLDKHALMLC